MSARDNSRGRRDRRRELLRALLEEEAEWETAEDLTAADWAAVARELRRSRRGAGGLISPESLQGFVLGMGAAAVLMAVLPSARQTLRPFAVAAVKAVLDLSEQVRGAVAGAGAGLQELVAEAQLERLRETLEPDAAAGPGGGAGPDPGPGPGGVATGQGHGQ